MNIIGKIRTSIEELKSRLIHGACASQIAMETRCKEEAYNEMLAILDSLEKSRVSVWHNTSEELPEKNRIIVINNDQTTLSVEYDEQTLCGVKRWAYLDDLLDIDKIEEESSSEYLNEELEKYFKNWSQGATDEGCFNPDSQLVSIYDCFRIAKHFASWQKRECIETAKTILTLARKEIEEETKQEILKDALPGEVVKLTNFRGEYSYLAVDAQLPEDTTLKSGDKVKVLIIKEQ